MSRRGVIQLARRNWVPVVAFVWMAQSVFTVHYLTDVSKSEPASVFSSLDLSLSLVFPTAARSASPSSTSRDIQQQQKQQQQPEIGSSSPNHADADADAVLDDHGDQMFCYSDSLSQFKGRCASIPLHC